MESMFTREYALLNHLLTEKELTNASISLFGQPFQPKK